MTDLPYSSVRATDHMVASADQVASRAGDLMFERDGNAVDAAIAANAAIAVTGPHLCGMGGDLFALVHTPDGVVALNASGRSGSGTRGGPVAGRGAHDDAVPPRHPNGHRARLRRRLAGAARPIRFAPTRRDPGAGDRPRRTRIRGQPAAGRLGDAARSRRGGQPPRARVPGPSHRCGGETSRCRSSAAGDRRARPRRLLRRRVRGRVAGARRRSFHIGRSGDRHRPTGASR